MKSNHQERYSEHRKYLEDKVQVHLKPMMVDILKSRPDNVLEFIVAWCQEHMNPDQKSQRILTEKVEQANIQSQQSNKQIIAKQPTVEKFAGSENQLADGQNAKKEIKKSQPTMKSFDDEDDVYHDEDREEMERLAQRKSKNKKKMAISAEVYGQENIKDFVPKVFAKTDEQITALKKILSRNFMFNGLDLKDQKIVIDAMEAKSYVLNDFVIRQGDDGNELFVVESGLLKCFQKRGETEVFLKNYGPTDLFGELALMYNVPRAASIIALEPSQLFSLDRTTFNAIVKGSSIKHREKYENFLNKIDLLHDLEPYERAKLCDCLSTEKYVKGDLVIREGEAGDKFYLIEEGTATAFKTDNSGNETKVFEYKENDYFGELALLNNEPRKASIRVTSDEMVVSCLDRESFKRLLGSLESILQRNVQRYEKYSAQFQTA